MSGRREEGGGRRFLVCYRKIFTSFGQIGKEKKGRRRRRRMKMISKGVIIIIIIGRRHKTTLLFLGQNQFGPFPLSPPIFSKRMSSFSSFSSFPFVILAIFAIFASSLAIRTQSVAVKGKLKCGDAPARNVRVKLFDEDGGPDPDDLLEAGYTDSMGSFSLKGSTTETTNIDVVFKVYHDCDDGIKPGSRKVRFKIPNSYVTEGQNPRKTFDLGTINLETVFADEERELIVSKKKRHLRHHRHLHERFNFFSHF